jgi:hypothetical protein
MNNREKQCPKKTRKKYLSLPVKQSVGNGTRYISNVIMNEMKYLWNGSGVGLFEMKSLRELKVFISCRFQV